MQNQRFEPVIGSNLWFCVVTLFLQSSYLISYFNLTIYLSCDTLLRYELRCNEE